MGESVGDQRQRVDRSEELDPKIKELAGFLTAAPLPNGTTARMDPGVAGMLAEAATGWQAGGV